MQQQTRRKLARGILALALLLLVWLRFQHTARGLVADFVWPFNKARPTLYSDKSRAELASEIDRLQLDLQQQEVKARSLGGVAAENDELRRLLALPPRARFRVVAARVVGRDPASGGRKLRLDRGAADDVAVGQAVLANGLFLGRIAETSRHSAIALTIADPNCRASVRIHLRGARGVLFGHGGSRWLDKPACVLKYLPRDLEYEAGQSIETSAYSSTIPAGIPVGRIMQMEGEPLVETVNQLYRQVRVKPFAFDQDFSFVAVLVARQPAATAAAGD